MSRRHRWIRGDWQIAALAAAARSRRPAAHAGGTRSPGSPDGSSSTTFGAACARRTDAPAAAGLGRSVLRLVLDLGGDRDHPDSRPDRRSAWNCFGSPPTCCCASTSPPSRSTRPAASPRRRSRSRACPTRRSSAWTRSCARPCGCCSRAGGSSNGTRRANAGPQSRRRALRASCAAMWIAPRRSPLAAAIYLRAFAAGQRWRRPRPSWPSGSPRPRIAWWISRPLARREATLLRRTRSLFLRKIARKTWAFFETFVGPEDHWLPPDNYQEHPRRRGRAPHVADQHGACAAREPGGLRLRLPLRRDNSSSARRMRFAHDGHPGAAPRSLLQLVRHADRCEPLLPLYISTVDSGNLAGHLLTLAAGPARTCRSADPR